VEELKGKNEIKKLFMKKRKEKAKKTCDFHSQKTTSLLTI